MADTVTIRLDRELARRLARVSRRLGRTRSEVVREALRRQLALLLGIDRDYPVLLSKVDPSQHYPVSGVGSHLIE